ncbi:MAG: hypothetical protein F2663_06985 [Actinobacteria bacterium]|uniref:Unannotated protein n=1 Tax=freshwater metagenome TaxID=449393 RepID=A0A6J6PSV3_9ZZZZ|nr:hypothetical protein [Actinomycetota bacterium]
MGRAAALLGLLLAWYLAAPHVGGLALWPSILLIAIVLMPAVFLLVWLASPLWDTPRLWAVAIALGVLTLAFTEAGFDTGANFTKIGAMTCAGWWFLGFFEELSWVVLVALLIPWVDAYSVWRGPTHAITSGGHEHVFTSLSIAFVVPGGGSARLGLPDLLFFAVFLGATLRFRLRPGVTWIALVAALGFTVIAAHLWTVDGLPALPGLAIAFLVPNADLIWRRMRPTSFSAS